MKEEAWVEDGVVYRYGRDGKVERVGTVDQVKFEYDQIESPATIGLRALEAGAKRSVSDIPGMAGDLLALGAANVPPPIGLSFQPQAVQSSVPAPGRRDPSMYPSEALRSLLDVPEPRGEGERLLVEGLAGAGGGALTAGAGAALRGAQLMPATRIGAMAGAGAGVGAQIAENLVDIPGSGLAGGLVGGLAVPAGGGAGKIAWTALAGGRGGLPKRVREIVSSMSDPQFARGQANMEAALKAGVPISVGQSLDTVGNPLATEAARLLRAPKVGTQAHRQLSEQGELAKTKIEEMTSSLDRPRGAIARGQSDLKPEEAVKKAASDALDANEKMRTAQVAGDYAFKVQSIPSKEVREFAKRFEDILREEGATTETADQARGLILNRLKLSEQKGPGGEVITAWETRPAALDSLLERSKQAVNQKFEGAGLPLDRHTANRLRTLVGSFQEFLDKYRVNPARGRSIYAQITKSVVEPAERGLLGQIAGPKGFLEDAPTIASRLNNIFSSEVNVTPHEISQAAKAMRQQDANAFPRFVRQMIEQEFERSAKSAGGFENVESLGNFIGKVWGSPSQKGKRAHFKALIAESARSMGNTEPQVREAVQSASNLMEALAGVARGRGQLASGVSQAAQAGAEGVIADVMRAQGPMMFQSPARRFEFFMEGKLNKQLFDLIFSTDPASMDRLRKLARYDPQTLRNALIASTAVGVEKEKN